MDTQQTSGSDSEPPKKKPMTSTERSRLHRQKRAELLKQQTTEDHGCKRSQSSPPKSTSSDSQMKKPMTPAERKRASRARQSEEKANQERELVRQQRATETVDQTQH